MWWTRPHVYKVAVSKSCLQYRFWHFSVDEEHLQPILRIIPTMNFFWSEILFVKLFSLNFPLFVLFELKFLCFSLLFLSFFFNFSFHFGFSHHLYFFLVGRKSLTIELFLFYSLFLLFHFNFLRTIPFIGRNFLEKTFWTEIFFLVSSLLFFRFPSSAFDRHLFYFQ